MRLSMLGAAVLALSLPSAWADPPSHAGKKGPKKGAAADRGEVVVGFSPRDRDRVRAYFLESHGRGHCPPGLAKKRNGCLPPGQAKKRYVVGRPLGRDVVIHALPRLLGERLGPAPAGYRYGIVDGDLVKLAVGTLLVVDAVDGLVN